MTVTLDKADFVDLLERAAWAFADEDWEWFLKGLSPPVRRRIFEEFFHWQAHGGQRLPPPDPCGLEPRLWFLRAGRGFGKTMAGAHWVLDRARETPGARIALVGGTVDEVRKVMIEGPGGLLALARSGEPVLWNPTQGIVRFHSGSQGFVYSARTPERLRGPEHHFAWCDELGKWKNGEAAWDNLQMGLRRGTRPRLIVTTTPRPTALVRRVRALAGTVETTGRTSQNVHSAEDFRAWAAETYGGTRLGRQELDGEMFEEVEGALWTRDMIEKARVSFDFAQDERNLFKRVVVGVDPPVKADGDACGIVVCALGRDDVAYVLADCTVSGERPEGWARVVVRAAEAWGAGRIVAERNQGGDMVESVMRNIEPALPVRLVFAKGSKAARAEPVAALFEVGRAKLAGRFPELEDELAGLTYGGGYDGQNQGPDIAESWGCGDRRVLRLLHRRGRGRGRGWGRGDEADAPEAGVLDEKDGATEAFVGEGLVSRDAGIGRHLRPRSKRREERALIGRKREIPAVHACPAGVRRIEGQPDLDDFGGPALCVRGRAGREKGDRRKDDREAGKVLAAHPDRLAGIGPGFKCGFAREGEADREIRDPRL